MTSRKQTLYTMDDTDRGAAWLIPDAYCGSQHHVERGWFYVCLSASNHDGLCVAGRERDVVWQRPANHKPTVRKRSAKP